MVLVLSKVQAANKRENLKFIAAVETEKNDGAGGEMISREVARENIVLCK